jgi:hypothetical protein
MRIALKKPFSDGTVAVDMDPLSLLCRLAASVPPPRFHLVRYAGIREPARGPPYWKSRVLRRAAGDDESVVYRAGPEQVASLRWSRRDAAGIRPVCENASKSCEQERDRRGPVTRWRPMRVAGGAGCGTRTRSAWGGPTRRNGAWFA